MKLTKHNVIVGLIILVIVIGGVILFSLLKSNKQVKDIYFDKYMALKDSMISHAQQDANNYRDLYLQSKKDDSLTMANLIQSQKIFRLNINESLKNIPINLARIANNDDSIRAAFSRN
jgi:hypothetical protein